MIYDLNVILIKILVVILPFQYAFFFFQYSHFCMTYAGGYLLLYRTTPEAQKVYESAVNHSTACSFSITYGRNASAYAMN